MSMTHKKERVSLIFYMVLLLSVGIASKIYKGPGFAFIHNKLGGVLYVMFWVLLFKAIFFSWKPIYISAGVMLASCGIEFSQLLSWESLEWIRNSFIGMTLIGHSFNFVDMIYYGLGAIISYYLLKGMEKKYA